MTLTDLITELSRLSLSLRRAESDAMEVVGDIGKLTPQMKGALATHKPALLNLFPPEVHPLHVSRFPWETDNDIWWQQITDEDYERLTSPRPKQTRCLFCNRFGSHSPMCDKQRRDWSRMRFGKYKGKTIADVPTKYLTFILLKRVGGVADREMILKELQRRSDRFRNNKWLMIVA